MKNRVALLLLTISCLVAFSVKAELEMSDLDQGILTTFVGARDRITTMLPIGYWLDLDLDKDEDSDPILFFCFFSVQSAIEDGEKNIVSVHATCKYVDYLEAIKICNELNQTTKFVKMYVLERHEAYDDDYNYGQIVFDTNIYCKKYELYGDADTTLYMAMHEIENLMRELSNYDGYEAWKDFSLNLY